MYKRIFPLLLLSLLIPACAKESKPPGQTAGPPPTAVAPTPPPVTVDMQFLGLVTVADQSALQGEIAKKTILVAKHGQHVPAFIVDQDELVSTQGLSLAGHLNGNDYYSIPLDGVQLLLAKDTTQWGDNGTSVDFNTTGYAKNDRYQILTGAGADTDSLHWVPSLSTITGQAVTLQGDYAALQPPAGKVAMRMALPGGKLTTIEHPPYFLWAFRTVDAQYKQAQVVADEVHYRFKLTPNQTTFDVWAQPLPTTAGGQPGTPKILFTLKPKAPGIRVIENVFVTNITAKTFGAAPPPVDVGFKDVHFYMHYDLLNEKVPQYEPVIIGKMQKAPPPHGVNTTIYCGPDTVP